MVSEELKYEILQRTVFTQDLACQRVGGHAQQPLGSADGSPLSLREQLWRRRRQSLFLTSKHTVTHAYETTLGRRSIKTH
jgi:hypothetical protein